MKLYQLYGCKSASNWRILLGEDSCEFKFIVCDSTAVEEHAFSKPHILHVLLDSIHLEFLVSMPWINHSRKVHIIGRGEGNACMVKKNGIIL